MKCRWFISLLLVFNVFCLLVSSVSGLTEKPNIIIILADDLGFNDVGFHGSEVRTPNLDALAGHGIILNRHYAQPCCTPSRAALMTAKYPIRIGMQGLPIKSGHPRGLPRNEKILPEYFKELGYKSHLVGKWHLGYETWAHVPTNRGFDSFYGFLNGFIGYYDATHSRTGPPGRDFRRDTTPIWPEVYGQYLTDVLSKEAVRLIENHEGHENLLLMLNHAAPHSGNFDFIKESPPGTTNFTGRAILADMIRWIDDSVGDVVATLNRKGILNNTIIVFLSDNGAPTEDDAFGFNNHGSNWPLRGLKFSNHEGGTRTAALIWSPVLSKARISTDLFHITDWLPTLYTAAGGRSSDINNVDGISHWESLASGAQGPRKEMLLNMDETFKTEALIQGQWKIIRNHGQDTMLAFTDKYFGVSGRNEPYDPTEVENSVAGRILGQPQVPYGEVRNQASINQVCLDKPSAEAVDCYTKYCIYNILVDNTECRDRSSEFPLIVSQLESKLSAFRDVLVPAAITSFDPKANPIFWNDYWSPWKDSGVSKMKSGHMYLLVFVLILMLSGQTGHL